MSASFNRVILIGNVVRDPELRHTPKGSSVCDLTLAINRNWTDEGGETREEVTFTEIVLWARTAEIAAQYLKKGSSCMIEGRLTLDQWDDKQSGEKRSRLKVTCENLQLLGSKPEGVTSKPTAATAPTAAQKRPAPAAAGRIGRDPDLDPEPNDIPFISHIRRDAQTWRGRRRFFL